MKNPLKRATLCFALFLVVISCGKEDLPMNTTEINTSTFDKKIKVSGFAENNTVLYWNDKAATVVATPRNQPTRARLLAMIQIAVHDALNSIKPKYQRYALQNEREQFASPDAAVASAAYWAIKGLNLQGNFHLDTWYSESLATIPDGESEELGKALGKKAADAIIANRANDGFTQVIITSASPADGDEPGEYRSTLRYVMVNGVLTLTPFTVKNIPNWGTVLKPFVVQSNYQFRPTGPNAVNSAAYTTDYNEIKEKGARVGGIRTANEEILAKFWSESRPSIIWNNLARNIIATKKMDAWKTARLFALIHTAMADGINSVMESKYHFYSWRPETAVPLANNDGNDNTAADANWLPYLAEVPNTFITPPIPEYPSSFAMFGGVTTAVLHSFFGSDEIAINLSSATLPETKLHYSSLSQAANDNSVSKIYCGWYFRKAVVDGEKMGRNIGNYVFNNHFQENEE
ncbi:hypothetical protein [Flavobacterium sp. XS2P39]|uniref:vanadium-dependent haloperoxidase n=1 Tax=Flavobacterium sp. XS2P39 TaxID=3401725 RepID=UPI003AAC259B